MTCLQSPPYLHYQRSWSVPCPFCDQLSYRVDQLSTACRVPYRPEGHLKSHRWLMGLMPFLASYALHQMLSHLQYGVGSSFGGRAHSQRDHNFSSSGCFTLCCCTVVSIRSTTERRASSQRLPPSIGDNRDVVYTIG